MWRAFGSLPPGSVTARQGSRVGNAFFDDDPLEGGEPIMVVSLTSVGIACRLGPADLLAQNCCPFAPGEHPTLVQCQSHGEGLSLPGFVEYRTLGALRDPRDGVDDVVGAHAGDK